MLPVLRRRIEQRTLHGPLPDAPGPVGVVMRIAQDGAWQPVPISVGRSPHRFVLTDDHGLESRFTEGGVLVDEAPGPLGPAAASEVTPEHHQGRTVRPELGQRAWRPGVVRQLEVGS